jgi:uncharacterized DUF497 family protein
MMKFQFDPEKAKSNIKKHGISFAEVEPVFFDALALTIEDESVFERRFITVGLDARLRLVTVCWTERGKDIRIISARLATTNERKTYENGI